MKKIRLVLLSLFTSAFCIFSISHTGLASEDTAAAAQDGHPQDNAPSKTSQEAPATPDALPESGIGIYENAGALWQSWMAGRQPEESPYPDYICGVWSTDGTISNLTFAVTKDEAGEAGKKEILDLVADDSTISFTYQSYPYHELWEILLTLREEIGDGTGAYGIGIYEDKNCVHIDMDDSNENCEAFMQECFLKYQDRVRFEVNGRNIVTAEDNSSFDAGRNGRIAGTEAGRNTSLWIWAVCTGMLFLFGVLFLRTRFPAILQTTKGSITASFPVTKKQAAEAIRKHTAEPSPGTFQSILEKLEEY